MFFGEQGTKSMCAERDNLPGLHTKLPETLRNERSQVEGS
jgi:hypothetical protein